MQPARSQAGSAMGDAMIQIRGKIRAIENGSLNDREDNPLKHAPHTAGIVSGSE